jgi:hypothetical protein
MALTYEICQLRNTDYSCESAGGDKQAVKWNIGVSYLVKVTDPANPTFNPSDINEASVAMAPGLPRVNRTTYYDSVANSVCYGIVCTSKKVKRTKENGTVFIVDVKYTSKGSGQGTGTSDEDNNQFESPVTNITDISPIVTAEISSEDVVLYKDKGDANAAPSVDPQNTRMMNGVREPFGAPVVENQSRLTLTVTQYESSITFQQMMDRSYKVNDDAWNGKARRQWKIGKVTAVEQEVQLASGTVTCAKVTYPITLSDYTVTNWDATSIDVYHDTALPLISPSWLDQNGVKHLFADEDTALGSVGLINLSGYLINGSGGDPTDAVQNGQPDYKLFYSNDAISFSFLQYGNP